MTKLFSMLILASAITTLAEPATAQGIKVTEDNYVQAETDWNFAAQQKQAIINTWTHNEPVAEKNQTIIRSNADVVYSLALVVNAGALPLIYAAE